MFESKSASTLRYLLACRISILEMFWIIGLWELLRYHRVVAFILILVLGIIVFAVLMEAFRIYEYEYRRVNRHYDNCLRDKGVDPSTVAPREK